MRLYGFLCSRALATVQTVKSSKQDADSIVKVEFISVIWTCVIRKMEAIPGRRVVHFEVDSLLPKVAWKVETVKLRGKNIQRIVLTY